MGYNDFIIELKTLGFEVMEQGDGRVSFPFLIPTGRLSGTQVRVGYAVPLDFPLVPPPGPHVSPRILPLNPQGGLHPNCGITASAFNDAFGGEWEYWSRPMPHWAQTKRTVRDVLAHLNRLMDTL
jgi:hypothetical protein